MSNREFLQVDPATLHLPGGLRDGVDPTKLHRQIARHACRSLDGELVINDGVTPATRVAKLLPGTSVTVEVTGVLPVPVGGLPTVRDRL
jgi:hypothetical protein